MGVNTVPFRVFEAAEHSVELALAGWSFGFDPASYEVISTDAHYGGDRGVLLVVRTMLVDSAAYPRSDSDEDFARAIFPFALVRSAGVAAVDRARAARKRATASDTLIEIDDTATTAIRVAADGHFAVAVTLGEVRLLISGPIQHEHFPVATRSAALAYTPPVRR